jgi:ligand-binding sensor domain-containing protein/signal transduction histidine kinase
MNQPRATIRASGQSRRRPFTVRRLFPRGLLAGIVALQFLLPGRSFALDPGKSIFQFNCQNWTRQNGLPADKIATITQSRDGYLWLGTQNGLVRFDGLEFKAVPIHLPQAMGQDVRQIVAAKNGGLLFAINDGGFGRFDGEKFSAIADARWAQPGLNATALLETHDGAIWTAAELGFGRWLTEDPAASFFIATNCGIVITLYEDAAGHIWLGTAEHGLFSWADGKFTLLPNEELKEKNIFAIAVDAEKHIWVGAGNGLSCYDANGNVVATPPFEFEVKALLVDRHGRLWIGTSAMGLACYDNGQFVFLKKADGLGGDYVNTLYEDAEGSLWVGLRDGLSQLSDLKFPIYSNHEGIGEGATRSVVAAQNGGLWIATDEGVCFFDGRRATNYNAESLLPSRYVRLAFQARNGDIYAVDGDKNINVFNGDRLLARYPNTIWESAIAEDATGVLVAVGENLFRIQDGKLIPFQYQNGVPPPYYWINGLFVANDGAIWVASNNGIFRVQNGTFKQWSTTEGLSGVRVFWLCGDADGTIWAGLPTGMARIKDGQLKSIKAENGLPDDRIYAIVPDDSGFLWCASGRGIFRAGRQNLNDFADGKSNRVDSELFDGLEAVKCIDRNDLENCGCKTVDGRIWFPFPGGVVMIDPAHMPTNHVAPPVHIERVLANGREFARSSNLLVPPGDGELEIHFNALSYIAPQKIRFRYQLAGYDESWVETEGRRMAFYTNLKPGRYTFRVMAANADGVWNETGDSFNLEFQPHFYQTVWFFLSGSAAVATALAGVYAWRVRHLRRRQRALQQARNDLEMQVQHRTGELATANASLKNEVGERQRTAMELAHRTRLLEAEIEERKQMERELKEIHRQLLDTSRRAGMAEVATNVLHNIGNVLNSVNVSASVVADNVKHSKAASLPKVAALLHEHKTDLAAFITRDPRGKKLPDYLARLSEHLLADQAATIGELDSLRSNIEHIKEIVTMQQNYAKVSGVKETVNLADLVADSLQMNAGSFERHGVEVIREIDSIPPMNVEKHKILQILVNLVRNAKDACDESGRPDKRLTIRVTGDNGCVKIAVGDNGVGIAPENLTRIFSHGFTTKKNGHGFGLHSGALAAQEMGGALTVQSAGPGQGATFTLQLPRL